MHGLVLCDPLLVLCSVQASGNTEMDNDMAQAIVGDEGMMQKGDVLSMAGVSNDGACNAWADMMGASALKLKVNKKKQDAPVDAERNGGEGQQGEAKETAPLSSGAKLSLLRDKLKAQGEKGRWYGNCLAPFAVAKDMSTNMTNHGRFMDAAFKRLNTAQANQALTSTQADAFEAVCQQHFIWFDKTKNLARKMEVELCPPTVRVKKDKEKGDSQASSAQKDAA